MLRPEPILFNDFKAQWQAINKDVLSAVDKVGNSGWLILGNEVLAFEESLAQYWGLSHAVGCANGMDALEIGLRCLGLEKGQKVLTTPLSAFASTLAILRAGGEPVFVDVDASGLIDLDLCDEVLKKNNDIHFFMPVHLYGHALQSQKLAELKSQYNLLIVEDCAQAIGAKSNGLPVGSIGDIAATSFYPTKNLGCMGDGGALLSQSESLAKHAKCLRNYGQTEKYLHPHLGLNSRLDEVQAAILQHALLPRLNDFTAKRKAIAKRYLTEIDNPNISTPKTPLDSDSVWHLYPILVKEKRVDLQSHLKNMGIDNGLHYPIIIPQQPSLLEDNISFQCLTEMSQATYFAEHELSLPIHPFLTDSDIERVIQACNNWQI